MRPTVVLGISLVIMTLLVFWPVGHFDFVNLDDNVFITENTHVNSGLTFDNFIWALTPTAGVGWHPVTWLSHMADVEMHGLSPGGHHLTSLLIHAAAALLLFILLCRLTGSPGKSAFVAAMFAVHPLHVESVAWLAERRDVLSGFFGFLTLLLYAEYALKRSVLYYGLALVAFLLGLMSKPILVTLPVVMMLLDIWPLNRYRCDEYPADSSGWQSHLPSLWRLFKEKIPFFAGSLGAALITINLPTSLDAMGNIHPLPLALRIGNAMTAYLRYLGKMFWPTDLAVLYPLAASIPIWQVFGSLVVLLTVTAAVIKSGRRRPYLLVGWFWFVIMLMPVLGVIQFGGHAIADRYTYLSLTGLLIAITWGVAELTSALPWRKPFLAVLAGSVVAVSMVLTWQQLHYWRNSLALFEHAIEVTTDNFVAHNNLGVAYYQQERYDEAFAHYQKAIAINPDYGDAYNNLGILLGMHARFDEAIEAFQRAREINPNYVQIYNNLGIAYAQKQLYGAAIAEFRKGLELAPHSAEILGNLNFALEQQAQMERPR